MIASSPAYEAAALRVRQELAPAAVLPARRALARRTWPLCLTGSWRSSLSMVPGRWSVVVLPSRRQRAEALIFRDGALVTVGLWAGEPRRLHAALDSPTLDRFTDAIRCAS